MSIIIVARVKAKQGSEKQLEDALRAMVPNVRSEAGTEAYILHKSVQDPGVFLFYEVYKDQAAVEAHRKTPHMATLMKATGGLVEGRMQVDVLSELDRK
jgi:quinol monooxygenase YgiN